MTAQTKRRRTVAISVAVLLALGSALLLTVDIDSPQLGRAVLDLVSGELRIDAADFELNLLRGLRLERVTVRGSVPAGRLSARAERLVLRHRVLPLLRGRLVLDTAVLEEPRIELDSEPAAATRAGSGGRGSAPVEDPKPEQGPFQNRFTPSLAIARIVVEDGVLEIRSGASAVEARGLDLELRDVETDPEAGSLLDGLAARGSLAADEIRSGSLEAFDARGEIELAERRMQIRDFAYRNETGDFRIGELTMDLGVDPFEYSLRLEGDPVHTNVLVAAAERGGFGRGRLELDVRGRGTDVETIEGKGLFRLEGGELPAHPVLEAIEQVVRGADLVGRRYEGFEVPFALEGNRVFLEPVELGTGSGRLSLEGWVDADGPLELDIGLHIPRAGIDIEEIPAEMLDGLTDAQGRLVVPLQATGTRQRPRVIPDRSALVRAARRGARERLEGELREKLEEELGPELGEKIGDGLRRLLGDEEEEPE